MSDERRDSIQRSWLDVRCTLLGSSQHDVVMKRFLDKFLSQIHSRTDVQFKTYFGDGNALVNMLCTIFIHNSKRILASSTEESISLASTTNQSKVVDALLILVSCAPYPDKSLASLAASFELLGHYNIVSTSLSLHAQLMDWVKLAKQQLPVPVSRLNLGYMHLLQEILCCPQVHLIQKSLNEATQIKHITLVATTLTKCYTLLSNDTNTSHLAEFTSNVLKQQFLHSPVSASIEQAVVFMENSIGNEKVNISDDSKSSVAVSFTCLLECIAFAAERIGCQATQTLDFGAVAAMMLALANALEASKAILGKRILICFEKMINASKKAPEPSPSVSRERGGIRQVFPETFSKLQQKIVVALTGQDSKILRPSLSCPGVFQCLVTLFICSTSFSLMELYGAELFQLFMSHNLDNDLREFILLSCHESIASFTPHQVRLFLRFLSQLSETESILRYTELLMNDFSMGRILETSCKVLFLEFYITQCERVSVAADLALERGVLSASLRCILNLLHDEDVNLSVFVEKTAVLCKVLVRSPAVIDFLMIDHTPSLLLSAILESTSLGRYDVSFILRDMFTSLVVKTGAFYHTLISTIADYTEKKPWRSGTSVLLAVLLATLQTGKHCEDAIKGNVIQLCLAMVCNIDNSDTPRVDLHFIGSCLSFLLPLVCYSDVWDMFDSSFLSLSPTTSNVQFMLDLCSGFFRTSESLTACFSYFESGDEAVLERMRKRSVYYGPYAVSERPFCEFKHPLKMLINWASEERLEIKEKGGDPSQSDVALAVEKFLLSTKIKLPNSFLAAYILEWKQPSLLCCVRDVASKELNSLFFGGEDSLDAVDSKAHAWLAALQIRDGESVENRCNIEFSEASGASGVIRCSGETWPPSEGYSTEIWVHWNYLSLLGRKDQRNSLWQLSWRTSDVTFSISFLVNSTEEYCHYLYEDDCSLTSVELPFIPPGRWVHVVTSHSRSLFHTSTLQVYYDGVLVSASPCPYPHTPIHDSLSLGSGLHTLSHDLVCTVGSSRNKPNANIVLRFISYTLFNQIVAPEGAAALYSLGAQSQGSFWAHSSFHEASLGAPYLRDEVLRSITVQQKLGNLTSCSKKGTVCIASPPDRALLQLHVRCMRLISSQLNYLNNKQWAFVNGEGTSSTKFIAYGSHTSPTECMCNEVNALLAHGAMHEWLLWINIIDAEMSFKQDTIERIILTVRRLLRVLVSGNKQTEFSHTSWRRFMKLVTNHVLKHPHLYLTDLRSLQALFAISACAPDTHRLVNESDVTLRSSLLYYTIPLEEIFFNWKVLSNLPTPVLHTILDNIEDLICPENPYHSFNAYRIYNADFFNGFVCGLFRQYVVREILERAVRCVSLMLSALAPRDRLLSELFTLCCLSIPDNQIGTHLGTKLLTTSLCYIETGRNFLLKCIHDSWDAMPPGRQKTFAKEMSGALSQCWFHIMTSHSSHPVTVILSMRIFVICFLSCPAFPERYKGDTVLALMEGLSRYAHQQELVEIIFMGFIGHVRGLTLNQEPLSFASVPLSEASGMEPLLTLTLHLLKRISQFFLHDEQVFSPNLRVHDYFNPSAPSPSGQQNRSSKLLRCFNAIRCGVRLKKKQKLRSDLDEVCAKRLPCAVSTRQLKTTMCEVLEWLAESYPHHHYVRHALYRSSSTANLIDLLSFPLVCAIPPIGKADDVALSYGGEKNRSILSVEDASSSLSPTPEDDNDDDCKVSTPVANVWSQNYDLTNLRAKEGFDRLYDACRSLYMSHALTYIHASDSQLVYGGGTRISKFVLSLHRALSFEIACVHRDVENIRASFLCSIWLNAAEQTVISAKAGSCVPKNIVALGKYTLDRLVGGCAIGPSSISSFLRFLLMQMGHNEEVQKSARTFFFEWLMYITNPNHYKHQVSRAAEVIELLYPHQDLLFACLIPVAEFVSAVLVRLMEITHVYISGCRDMDSPVSKKLGSIWYSFINANEGVTTLMKVLVCTSSGAFLVNSGFSLLLPPVACVERFLVWLKDNAFAFERCAHEVSAEFNFLVSEGPKYNRMMKKTIKMYRAELSGVIKLVSGLNQASERLWRKFTDTTTFVDPTFLTASTLSFPSTCIIGCPNTQKNEHAFWFWHESGSIGKRSLCKDANVDDLLGEPLSHYIMYAPLVCVPLHPSTQEPALMRCGLRRNAFSLLSKISGPYPQDSPQWVGNVYFIVGTHSHVCTLTVTAREVVIISCSEVTKSGDFFIAHVRPHLATQKSRLKSNFMHDTLRRIILYQSVGPVTNSEAAFRFSQYYRQVCTESAIDARPSVWRFPLLNVSSLHQRLFQHMPTGLEFILETGERFFVVVLNQEFSFSRSMCDRLQHAVEDLARHITVQTLNTKRSKLSNLTKLWVNQRVTNFDYLSMLNDAASRTVGDVGQYPVMPWVLQEYQKDFIQISDTAIYRDLSKPIGAINPTRADQLRRRYADWFSEGEPPFHHGTHYSSAAVVYYYLLRLQPFTIRSIGYQGGRLDIPDRLFHSIAEAWDSSSGPGTGDTKELIPEFFRVSGFLLNRNNTRLGSRRNGEAVGDVVLPPWTRGDAVVFVHFNALCLESDYVSEHLNQWIDLIFGYKQIGEEAASSCNVFHYLSYQKGVEQAIVHATTEEERRSIVASADNFGQTPLQLFSKGPHPKRLCPSEATPTQYDLLANAHMMQAQMLFLVHKLDDSNAPVTRLFEITDTIYGSAQNITLSVLRPTMIFTYLAHTHTIRYGDLRQGKQAGTLPLLYSFGCGSFTNICASKSGNLICVGTNRGKVILFTRHFTNEPYIVTTVMHSSGEVSNPVRFLGVFDEGSLIVTHELGSLVTGWHISYISSMHCFSLNINPDHRDDAQPVTQVVMNSQQRIYYGAKSHSVVIFTVEGVILGYVELSEMISIILSKANLTTKLSATILSIAYCNCASFYYENVIYLGLENGLLLLMRVSTSKTFGVTEKILYTIHPHYSFPFSSPVTSIMVLNEGRCVVVGLETGHIEQLVYPSIRDTSDSESFA